MTENVKAEKIMQSRKDHEDDGYVRVLIPGDTPESLWCRPTEDDPDKYVVCNIPVMSDKCCVDDVITLKTVNRDEIPRFARLVQANRDAFFVKYDLPESHDDEAGMSDEEREEIAKRVAAYRKAAYERLNVKVEGVVAGILVAAYSLDDDPAQTAMKLLELSEEFDLETYLPTDDDEEDEDYE